MSSLPAWLLTLQAQQHPAWVSDTRQLQAGDIFIALSGQKNQGQHFIQEAIQRGAVGIISDSPLEDKLAVPCWIVPNLRTQLSTLLHDWYPDLLSGLILVGVTGTNGKTSITHLLAQLWQGLGQASGIVGTLGIGALGALAPNSLTTPDICTIYRHLYTLKQQGIRQLAMEVSSHALVQKRIQGLAFQSVIFSNLTQDHLDYHGDMENYFLAKQALFTDYPSQARILNADDPYAQRFIQACRAGKTPLPSDTPLMTYGLEAAKQPRIQSHTLALWVEACTRSEQGVSGRLVGDFGTAPFTLPLLGDFQLSNALAAVLACLASGYALSRVAEQLSQLTAVPGRLNRLGGGDLPNVVIDFAHTPDALAHILLSVKPYIKGQCYVVFGCGGERDRDKRPKMLSVALAHADHVLLTADNPRQEPLSQILSDTLQGISDRSRVGIQLDRKQAVYQAIHAAKPGDMVILAGKGHETVQIIGENAIPYHEATVAKAALEAYPVNYSPQ